MGESGVGLGSSLSPATTYNFHDLFSVRVQHRALDDLMADEFSAFADGTRDADLTIEEGEVPLPDGMLASDYLFDDESLVVNAKGGRIRVTDGHLMAEPKVRDIALLEWVRNLMRFQVLARGATLVHASAVARDGKAYLFPAWRQTGKTNLALAFLRAGYDYLSDDWCFVTSSGQVMAYPRSLNLFRYHFEVHPFLQQTVIGENGKRDIRRRLSVGMFADSLDASSAFGGRLRQWISDRYFVNLRTPVSRAVPGSRTVLRARLTKACLVVASRHGQMSIREMPRDELARRAVLSGDHERSKFRMHLLALAYVRHRDPEPRDDVIRRETAVLRSALTRARCFLLMVPPEFHPPDFVRALNLCEQA